MMPIVDPFHDGQENYLVWFTGMSSLLISYFHACPSVKLVEIYVFTKG